MFRNLLRVAPLVSLLLGLLLMPTATEAAWLGFRNDLGQVVVVQTYPDGREGSRPGAPHRLYPGETTWDWVCDTSLWRVNVSDGGRSPTLLLRGAEVRVGKEDVLFVIQPEKGTRKVELRKGWEGSRSVTRAR